MQIYLPIAEMPINALIILILGAGVGFLSGLFGVGGGFLMTPFLIFLGVPPAVAVGTQANQLVAASVSGVIGHWRRKNVDVKLGTVMLVGGFFGSLVGVQIFALLKKWGQVDVLISLSYVFFLGTVGLLMLAETVRSFFQRRKAPVRRKLHAHNFLHRMPFKMRFPRSRLYISALLPGAIGFVGGVLVSIMGIGGGFLLVPAMIYVLGMPALLVAGTSLYQIIATTAVVTVLQAVTNQTVDVVLAVLLIVGGVIGAQFGARVGGVLRGEQARALLAILIVMVALKLGLDMVLRPDEPYSVTTNSSATPE
jgi:uncharacterized membrane protein YfcA